MSKSFCSPFITGRTALTDSIPATKSKSKIKPLKEKIQTLEYEKENLLEEMYEKGTRTRPSIMTQIEEKEADLFKHIQFIIAECEKVTGRTFPYYLANYITSADLIAPKCHDCLR